MTELDPGRLMQKTRELVTQSKELHERSRRAVSESKRLQDRLLFPTTKRTDGKRRKRLLEK